MASPEMSQTKDFDNRRRRLLLGGASLASLSAAGCSTVPSPQIPGLCHSGSSLFLGGAEVQQAWAGEERYFDAHTHFFNASDVPVSGFLAKSVAHSIEDSGQRQLLIELAPIVEVVGKTFAPTPAAEMEQLCNSAGRAALMSLKAQSDELERIGFSNALFPEHGKTTAEQREQRWDTASEALEPAFGCRPKSVGRGQPGREASFLASSTG